MQLVPFIWLDYEVIRGVSLVSLAMGMMIFELLVASVDHIAMHCPLWQDLRATWRGPNSLRQL